MTTVPPPTTPPPDLSPAAQALLQGGPTATILNPPPTIATLPPGATLDGVIQPQPQTTSDPSGPGGNAVIVHTMAGDVTMRLPAPLPVGATVELQVIRTSADQTTVRLVSIDNQPAGPMLAQLRQNAPAPPATPVTPPQVAVSAPVPPANAWTPQGPSSLPALGTISAYVIQGAPSVAPEAPATLPLPSAAATPDSATAPTAVNAANPEVPLATPTPSPPFALLTSGELAVRVTQVILPAPSTPSPQAIVPTIPIPLSAASPPIAQALPVSSAPDDVSLPDSSPQVSAPPSVAADPAAPPPIATADPAPVVVSTAAIVDVAPAGAPPALVLTGPTGDPPPFVPPAPPQVPDPMPPLATLSGVVVAGSTATNAASLAVNDPTPAPIVSTALGQIQLNIRANLPPGTRVMFEIAAQGPPQPDAARPAPTATLPLSGPPLAGPSSGWPNLSEAVQVLQRSDPVAATQLAAAIPDGGPRTVVALMAFVQAMRSGDTRQWPGDDPLRALERAGPRGAHLAGQISDEVSALSARARTPGPEWRMLPVPWNADGQIDRIALITRREEADDSGGGKKRGGDGTRFLINLDLSRLGPLQLDGMFRKEARGFDMILRTKAPLPDAMRYDLTTLFADSTAAMGLKGGLAFQVVRKFPDPTLDPRPADKTGLWA